MKQSILVVGPINMDLIINTTKIPNLGQVVFGENFKVIPGGKGANQAISIARLSKTCESIIAGRVGNDYYGTILLEKLKTNNVYTKYVERDLNEPSGVTFVMITPEGENSILIATGSNGEFSIDSAKKLKKVISRVDLVLLQLELPLKPVAKIIDIARNLGKIVILDAGPPCCEPLSSFFRVNILTPNKNEAEALSGKKITDIRSGFKVGQYLLNKGPDAVVIKIGENGSLLITKNKNKHFAAYKVDVIDTTAAGDAFSAALSLGIIEGKSYEEAIKMANAAGALATTKLGAQTSLPTRQELEDFMRKYN